MFIPLGDRKAIGWLPGVPFEGYAARALEKALFLPRLPGLANRLRLLDDLAIEPLVQRGIE